MRTYQILYIGEFWSLRALPKQGISESKLSRWEFLPKNKDGNTKDMTGWHEATEEETQRSEVKNEMNWSREMGADWL